MEINTSDIFATLEQEGKQVKDFLSYNIMLIGFMGAGKTTVSSYLSNFLDMEEVDTDKEIVKRERKTIPQIFEEDGEEYFRNCETSILLDLQKRKQLIVSCGGGIVLRDENVSCMKKQGRIVLLTATPKTILERVKDSKERPILNNNMNEEFIASLMEKRRERYLLAADLIIETDNKTVEEICKELVVKLIQSNKE